MTLVLDSGMLVHQLSTDWFYLPLVQVVEGRTQFDLIPFALKGKITKVQCQENPDSADGDKKRFELDFSLLEWTLLEIAAFVKCLNLISLD